MNRIFTLLLALLACTAHVSAQTAADTLRAGAAVSGDTLIAVDEQTLVERLAQLLRERRAQHCSSISWMPATRPRNLS